MSQDVQQVRDLGLTRCATGCVWSWVDCVVSVGVGASWGGLVGGMHGAGECLPVGSPRAEAAAAGGRAGGRSLG
eukprot:1993476-Alexandrium_andersonii.AAC.1